MTNTADNLITLAQMGTIIQTLLMRARELTDIHDRAAFDHMLTRLEGHRQGLLKSARDARNRADEGSD